jgi:hypothetical protein
MVLLLSEISVPFFLSQIRAVWMLALVLFSCAENVMVYVPA